MDVLLVNNYRYANNVMLLLIYWLVLFALILLP